MADREVAIAYAGALFAATPPVRLDHRDLTFLTVAAALIGQDPPPDKRLRAIEMLESELYPEGAPHGGLTRPLTGKKPSTPERRRGGDPFAYKTRDLIIVHAIAEVSKAFGYNPTRSRASKDKAGTDSACSIVMEALRQVGVNMSEEAVERIWNHRNSLWPADAGPAPKGSAV